MSPVRLLNIWYYLLSTAEYKKELQNNQILRYEGFLDFFDCECYGHEIMWPKNYPSRIVTIILRAVRVSFKLVRFHVQPALFHIISSKQDWQSKEFKTRFTRKYLDVL